MACRTPSVERVVDETTKAKEQIDKLQAMIESQAEENKTKFFAQIDTHLSSAGITDAREIGYNYGIKTEYTSEFSLDKIAAVVTSSLHAVKAVTAPAITNPAISPAAIDAYVNVVNTIAEAAKSSSTAAASVSFSMNRLSPGMFAFLFASSMNIKDDKTFGKEAVTTTAIYYRFVQSIQDLKLQGEYDAERIRIKLDLSSYEKWKTLQVALIDELGNGTKDLETYVKLDAFYGNKAAELKAKLDAVGVSSDKMLLGMSEIRGAEANQQFVLSAINKLSEMGDSYNVVIERAQARIANGYF